MKNLSQNTEVQIIDETLSIRQITKNIGWIGALAAVATVATVGAVVSAATTNDTAYEPGVAIETEAAPVTETAVNYTFTESDYQNVWFSFGRADAQDAVCAGGNWELTLPADISDASKDLAYAEMGDLIVQECEADAEMARNYEEFEAAREARERNNEDATGPTASESLNATPEHKALMCADYAADPVSIVWNLGSDYADVLEREC